VHNEEPRNLYILSNSVRFFELRRRWAGHVAHVNEVRNTYKIFIGNPHGRNHAEGLGVGVSITLKWVFVK